MLVLNLVVDSYSRRHFFRTMPRTINWLNSANRFLNFSVFDFKLHNVYGTSSVENMIPMLGGNEEKETEGVYEGDFLGDGALWQTFKSYGFVTMLGFENCDYHFPNNLGRVPEVDYLVRQFYCAAVEFF